MAESVRREVTVPWGPEDAFGRFAGDTGSWWPREFTWSQEVLVAIGIEAGENGMCFELGPHGFRCDWGRVLLWDPPRRLVLTWQIGPDRVPVPDATRASEVHVTFEPAGDDRTRVVVEHRAFERHGPAGDAYAAGMGQGWDHLLARYAGG
jgi:uncharacterized protein YndB with AHSA1/START domain